LHPLGAALAFLGKECKDMKKVWLSASTMHGIGIIPSEDVSKADTVSSQDFLGMLGSTFKGEVFSLFDLDAASEITAMYYTCNDHIEADLKKYSF
jgi:hypothetical protein